MKEVFWTHTSFISSCATAGFRFTLHVIGDTSPFFFPLLRADSGDLSNHGSHIANVIKAAPGLIFKRWELAVALCANTANYQAVIKTAF